MTLETRQNCRGLHEILMPVSTSTKKFSEVFNLLILLKCKSHPVEFEVALLMHAEIIC